MSEHIFIKVDPDRIEVKPGEWATIAISLSSRLRGAGCYWLQVEGVLPDWMGLLDQAASLPHRPNSVHLRTYPPPGRSGRVDTLLTPRPTSTLGSTEAPESGFALDCPQIAKGPASSVAVGRATTPNRIEGAS